MAVINYKGEDNPSEKNRFGTVSGVDLKTPPILNENPLDIENVNGLNPGEVYLKWLVFSIFLKNKNITTDINSLEGRSKISLELINEFNENVKNKNPYLVNFPPLNRADIEAIQRFTKKTDPNIQVDGWVGTQTVQLKYPLQTILEVTYRLWDKQNKPDEYGPNRYPSNTLVPIIWGNKRYVVPVSDYLNSLKTNKISFPFWRLYDPSTDKSRLPYNTINKTLRTTFGPEKMWEQMDNDITIEDKLNINQTTLKEQQNKLQLSEQTKLVNSLR
jgi:hypothetical protein